MASTQHTQFALIGLWLLLVLVSLFSRSFFPIDETRYVTVAWNMWLRGDYLVPYLNNIPYSHKPPLLFWLMNIGWAVFGVNDWWPRLVPSFFALGSMLLTERIAIRLWPQSPQTARLAPLVLLGCALWTLFTTATMFDMMVAFFTLLGVLGLLIAWQDRGFRGWGMLGLAIGGGLLAKGPAILMQLLPLALSAPWWNRGLQPLVWKRWYAGILAVILLGAMIALAWAVPAGLHGGHIYQHDIFWGQTADRMVHSFAHRRPFWWYLPLLPVLLFPWLFWMPAWRGFKNLRLDDVGVRFCLAWLIPVFIGFSLISGKQVHYLLPIFPAFSLLVARGLMYVRPGRHDAWLFCVFMLMAGGLLIYLPFKVEAHGVALWFGNISPWAGACMILLGMIAVVSRSDQLLRETWKMTILGAAAVCVALYWGGLAASGLAYDLRPAGAYLKRMQDQGIPLAHLGKYAGQYQFVGRMLKEPEVVEMSELEQWFTQHPQGKVITYFNTTLPIDDIHPDYRQAYRGDEVVVLSHESWKLAIQHPEFRTINE